MLIHSEEVNGWSGLNANMYRSSWLDFLMLYQGLMASRKLKTRMPAAGVPSPLAMHVQPDF